MMTERYVDEILEAAAINELPCRVLPEQDAARLRDLVEETYAVGGTGGYLWDALGPRVSVHGANTWRLIGEYLGNKPFVVFFDRDRTLRMIDFVSGADLEAVLSESTAGDVYLANMMADFLWCFNHHDFLIACGDAAVWMKARGLGAEHGL